MSLHLGLDVSQAGPTTVVFVRGELDLATAPDARALLGTLLASGVLDVAVDLGGLEFVDSHGLAALAAAADDFAAAGGRLRLSRPPRLARTVLAASDLADRLPVVAAPL